MTHSLPSPALPDEVIEGLRQLTDTAAGLQWATGDYLVGVVDEFTPYWERSGVRNGRAAIIGQLAASVGVDGSTLRDRECMARFYPTAERVKYDMLTYHQLRACKSAGPAWRTYADWAAGSLASVAKIRDKIAQDHNGVAAWVGRWDRLLALADMIIKDDSTALPAGVRAVLRVLVLGG